MKLRLIYIFLFLSTQLWGQSDIWIKPNKGQWHPNVDYKIITPNGDMYLENQGFTYVFSNRNEFNEHRHHHSENKSNEPEDDHGFEYQFQVVKTHLVNSNLHPTFIENGESDHYENYFLGSDSSKWVKNIHLYNEVIYQSVYPGINMSVYESNATLKYDFIVKAGFSATPIKIDYKGADQLYIDDLGQLHVETKFGGVIEKAPLAYQMINGIKHEVSCEFVLTNQQLTFHFPEGYNTNYDLIIDPELAFSTFTGASSDNWGMTACPDINGKLIAGGIVFGSSYPLVNAFDNSYNNSFGSSRVDVGITKYTQDGSAIEFSTFIGGDGSETPHSLIVNEQNELYILGATSSSDFPVSASAYQTTHAGGGNQTIDGINFFGGIDIYIFKLSAAGNTMLGSTYLGGSSNDGVSTGSSDIAYNYGDNLRGEIIVDENSNVYINSSTKSSDFPIVNGFDNSLDGSQDAVIAKLNSNLTTLNFSTYVGGSGYESGNSIQLASNGDIYAVGGTTSSNFPQTSGQLNSNFMGVVQMDMSLNYLHLAITILKVHI